MAERFFHAGEWNQSIELSGSEAHHLQHVLRKRVGDEVELFNGRGERAPARVSTASKRGVSVELLGKPVQQVRRGVQLTLAVAPPKADRLRWLVEKGTELGVATLIPLQTTRTVVRPGETKLDKLRQTVVGACKQSGRDDLLELTGLQSLSELLVTFPQYAGVYFGVIGGQFWCDVATSIQERRYSELSLLVLIGPEGGWTPEETHSLQQAGATGISVSSYTLRIETAALALASLVLGGLPPLSE